MNDTALRLYEALGPWADTDSGFLAALCDALTSTLDTLIQIEYGTPDVPGWAVIMDPNTAPEPYLQWLGQMVGVEVNPLLPTAQQRDSILDEQGFNRGTVAYLRSTIQALLTGDKQFIIHERDTSPYHATVSTYIRQTPDQSAVIATIAANKPAGLIIAYVPLHAASFAEVRASKVDQTFAAGREATYPTFADVLEYVP